jgi:heme/copper-type cytochrome/quinol oxidase subunit 2
MAAVVSPLNTATPSVTSSITPRPTATPKYNPPIVSPAKSAQPQENRLTQNIIYVIISAIVITFVISFAARKIGSKQTTNNSVDKPKANKTKLMGAIIILTIIVSSCFVAWNTTINAPKPPKENIVYVTIIIESNVDWYGSVTITGPDYGFYPFSGSLYDSGNGGSKACIYNYTANTVDLDIHGQFQINFFGDIATIYDGYLHAREYINGTLEFNKTITPYTSSNGFDWWYQAGYS